MTEDTYTPPEGYVDDDIFGFLAERRNPSRRIKRMLKYRHQKWYPTFMQLSRKKRRDLAVSRRWRIRTDPNGAGVFTSHDILPGSREWPGDPVGEWAPHAWADFYFMSAKPIREGIFYNAVATTALEKAALAIEDLAEEAMEAQLSEEDKKTSRMRTFSKPTKGGGLSMVFAPEAGVASLGGLTKGGAKAKWLRENWDNLDTLVDIHPKAEIDMEYEYGIGLHLVVPQTSVDTRTLPEIIQQFLERGEVEFEDERFDLSEHIDILRLRLGATLWRWDSTQAKAEGREMEEPGEELWPYFDTQSNAIRM